MLACVIVVIVPLVPSISAVASAMMTEESRFVDFVTFPCAGALSDMILYIVACGALYPGSASPRRARLKESRPILYTDERFDAYDTPGSCGSSCARSSTQPEIVSVSKQEQDSVCYRVREGTPQDEDLKSQ
jgi:hypothetical protein